MKVNNELERKDMVIDRDMEVDCDEGTQITAYIETWFDVDKKFMVHTDADEGTWLNMYAKYNPFEDIKCVHMAYLQLSLYGIPAVIIHGNSLTNEEWSRWYTPVYMINGWPFKERVENLFETINEATKDRQTVNAEEVPQQQTEEYIHETEIKEYEQISLF